MSNLKSRLAKIFPMPESKKGGGGLKGVRSFSKQLRPFCSFVLLCFYILVFVCCFVLNIVITQMAKLLLMLSHICRIFAGLAKVSEGEYVRNNHLYRPQHWLLHGLLHRCYLGVPKTSLRVHEQEPDVTLLKTIFNYQISSQIKSNVLNYPQ